MNTTPDRLALWSPPVELSAAEEAFCGRMERTGRLYAFLRRHRHELFDEPFQQELLGLYSQNKVGAPPVPPAMLGMVTLLQALERRSDAGAVEQTVFDRRWQMVLDCHDIKQAAFSQGVLVEFRFRMIEHGLDKRLIERTVELSQKLGGFSYKALRIALDSAPLWGAGRVEDTFNLIAHATEVVVQCAAVAADRDAAQVMKDAGLVLVGQSSVKAALDIDWDDDAAKHEALQRLLAEVQRLRAWVDHNLADAKEQPLLKEALALLAKVVEQDLEPDPDGGGKRVARGTAKDRQISIMDKDMRHGRKSKSRLFNGYKRHVAVDLDHGLILAVTARPANEPEADATTELQRDVEVYGTVTEMNIDRGYLASRWIDALDTAGVPIVAKPWHATNRGLHPKSAFRIDLVRGDVTCPQGDVATIRKGHAEFAKATCAVCPARAACTRSKAAGRTVAIHAKEALLLKLRAAKDTTTGRTNLRNRTAVEHRLAHLTRRQGPRARYWGLRKNVFDLRRTAAVENLNVIDRMAAVAGI